MSNLRHAGRRHVLNRKIEARGCDRRRIMDMGITRGAEICARA